MTFATRLARLFAASNPVAVEPVARAARAAVESLEGRTLFAATATAVAPGDNDVLLGGPLGGDVVVPVANPFTTIVSGTPGNDVVVLDGLKVTLNGNTFTVESNADIEINVSGGNDKVTIKRTLAANPVLVNSGTGNDTVTLGGGRLDSLAGKVRVADGGGTDELVVNDTQQTSDIRAVELTRTNIFEHEHVGIERFTFNLGSGDDTFRLKGLSNGQSVTVKGNGGNDIFEVGAGQLRSNVGGASRFEGGSGTDALEIDDTASPDGTKLTVGASTIGYFGESSADVKTLTFLATESMRLLMGDKADNVDARTATVPIEMRLGGGDDVALGGTRDDFLHAGEGNDQILDGGGGDDLLSGEGGKDTLFGGVGDDTVVGGDGDDTLGGGDGDDLMVGDAGNDAYRFGNAPIAETDIVVEDAPGGVDTLNFQNVTTPVTVNLGSDTLMASHKNRTVITGAPGRFKFFDNAIGGSADDKLTGNGGANVLTGNAGKDTLVGLGGNDTLLGNAGDDTLDGGEGSDTLDGGANNDTYKFAAALATQTDTIVELSGGGTDTLDFSALASTDPVAVDLTSANTTVAVHTRRTVKVKLASQLAFLENAIGGRGNDQLSGNLGRNRLVGNDGNDTLIGSDGIDELFGNKGNDTFFAGDGTKDLLDGGDGTDSIESVDAIDTKVGFP